MWSSVFSRLVPSARDRAGFCAASNRLLEVGVEGLQVVAEGDLRRVADPRRDNVDRVVLHQVRLATGTKRLEQPRPRRQPGPPDELFERRAEIGVDPPARLLGGDTVVVPLLTTDDVHLPRRGQLPGVCEVRTQASEEGVAEAWVSAANR